jgi:hypothetical protein
MHVDGAASRTATNEGVITATAQTDATVTAQINVGNGQTLMAVYTVPAGKTAYMTRLYASITKSGGSAAAADVALWETPFASTDGSGSRVVHFDGITTNGSGFITQDFKPYKQFLEQTDIWIRVQEVSATVGVTGGFDIILEDD